MAREKGSEQEHGVETVSPIVKEDGSKEQREYKQREPP